MSREIASFLASCLVADAECTLYESWPNWSKDLGLNTEIKSLD